LEIVLSALEWSDIPKEEVSMQRRWMGVLTAAVLAWSAVGINRDSVSLGYFVERVT